MKELKQNDIQSVNGGDFGATVLAGLVVLAIWEVAGGAMCNE
jgi:hypothetical protein